MAASRVRIPPSPSLAERYALGLALMGETMFPPCAPFFAVRAGRCVPHPRARSRVRLGHSTCGRTGMTKGRRLPTATLGCSFVRRGVRVVQGARLEMPYVPHG